MKVCYFFFSSRRRHTRCSRDWSSDVCSSDLKVLAAHPVIIVIDKDEDPFLEELQLSSWIESVAPLRVLYLALQRGLEGPIVALGPWDREAAMLWAHRRSGAEGIQRMEKVAAS